MKTLKNRRRKKKRKKKTLMIEVSIKTPLQLNMQQHEALVAYVQHVKQAIH
jgi:hypothetical protein